MLIEVQEKSDAVSASLWKSARTYTPYDEAADLITGQINFALAYVKEARAAYECGNFAYGEIARKIALNAYSAAVRFSEHLLHDPQQSLVRRIEALECELEGLLEPVESGLRSIA